MIFGNVHLSSFGHCKVVSWKNKIFTDFERKELSYRGRLLAAVEVPTLRSIEATILARGSTVKDVDKKLKDIGKWLYEAGTAKLFAERDTTHYYLARCTSVSTPERSGASARITVVFTCADNRLYNVYNNQPITTATSEMNNFTFAGKHCLNDMGCVFVMDSMDAVPTAKVNKYEIAGQSGTLRYDSSEGILYEEKSMSGTLYFVKQSSDGLMSEEEITKKLHSVAAWLGNSGRAQLILDSDVSRYYEAEVDGNQSLSRKDWENGSIKLKMTLQPFASDVTVNLYAQQFADNADTNHPASMRVYVPSECKKINKMLLSWRLSAFRAYETGASAGGASVSTTSAGGGSERTSSAGGATTATAEQRVVTTEASTGGTIAGHQGDTSGNTGYARDYNGNSKPETGECAAHNHTMQHHHPGPSHTHTIDAHSHTGGSHSHIFGHYHSAPAHTHTIDGHTHSGPSHTHSGPSHTHSFSGSQSIANGHTHKVTCKASGTTVTSQGVSTNATHTVKISGTTGAAGTGSTGSAGTGQTSSTALTTNSGGGGLTGNAVYASGNAHTSTAEGGNVETSSKSLTTNAGGTSDTGYAYYAGAIKNNTGDGGVHTHDMRHVHNFSHSHNVVAVITIPAITLKVPSHTHSVSIPDHSHTVTIQEHTHEIIYGIYEGNTAKSVSINVDGTDIPAADLSADEMDIVKYLSKDSNGKIQRGTWHEIKIIPDGLSRIEANLFVQTFVTSYSGGNY